MEKKYISNNKSEKQKSHEEIKFKNIHPIRISNKDFDKICNIPFKYVNGQFIYQIKN